MKVLFLHNAYQQAGGEDAVVENELRNMREAGLDVRLELIDNSAIRSGIDKLRAGLNVCHDAKRARWLDRLLADWRPDIVHVHNFFPLLTLAAHERAKHHGAKVVQTLHNYRLGCAKATFERDGAVCEDCLGASRFPAIRHRCYRGSAVGSLAVTRLQRAAVDKRILIDNVDRFIALTEFAKRKFEQIGLPADRIAVKPNFVGRPVSPPGAGTRQGCLFVGRLSGEKGVDRLIEAWQRMPYVPLRIAGSGPLEQSLRRAAPGNVTFLGALPADRVEQEMRKAAALLVPSVCYEGFPMTVVEAFASGLPVIASRIGSLAEIVREGETGRFFEAGDPVSLADAVNAHLMAGSDIAAMSAAARQTYERHYTAERNAARLLEIYHAALADPQGKLPG